MIYKMKEEIFTEGEKVKYIGKGFLGYKGNDSEAIFKRYEGFVDAYIVYDGSNVLVRKHEIEKIKKKK